MGSEDSAFQSDGEVSPELERLAYVMDSGRWPEFAHLADQYLLEYALPTPSPGVPKLFCAAHAVELYLKAVLLKLGQGGVKAMNSHDLAALLRAIRVLDTAFLPDVELRESILNRDFLTQDVYGSLGEEDRLHFITTYPLYLAAKLRGDMKYLGTPLKLQITGTYSYGAIFPDDYWIALIKRIRAHLGFPEPGRFDLIRYWIDRPELAPSAQEYLRPLLVP